VSEEPKSIIVSTTDPQYRGGVWGVTKALIDGLTRIGARSRIKLIYPTTRSNKTGPVLEAVEGIPAVAMPCRSFFANAYGSHLLSDLPFRKDLIEAGAINIAVGGGNQTAMPFLLRGQAFSLWVSNTVDDEYEQLFKGRPHPLDVRSLVAFRLFRPATRAIEKWIFNRATKIFTESRYSLGVIARTYGIPSHKLIYLPYPVDLALQQPGTAVIKGRYILFVGRVDDPRKNVTMLINAFAAMHVSDVRLVLAGRFREDGLVARRIRDAGIGDRVILPGFVDDALLQNLLAHAHVFVMPSLQEGLGNAVIEALSHGIPVVATRCGGVEDSVVDGQNGFLVNVNDVETMANRLDTIFRDDQLRQRLSANAVKHIEEYHSWAQFEKALREKFLTQ
jgi:glycosyltransferase involved in cell wall biosynthesis